MPKITELYAFIVEGNSPDDEGVIEIQAISREYAPILAPLVGADMARVESLRPIAQDIGQKTGKKVTLVHFTNREDLEVIQ